MVLVQHTHEYDDVSTIEGVDRSLFVQVLGSDDGGYLFTRRLSTEFQYGKIVQVEFDGSSGRDVRCTLEYWSTSTSTMSRMVSSPTRFF